MPDFAQSFSTVRLSARRISASDLEELLLLHRDPRVMATLSATGDVLTAEENRARLEANLAHWERHGFGLWTFRLADGRFAGRAGLRRLEIEGRSEVELAYAVPSELWGQGLATEMARAVLAVGFEQLELAENVCFTLPANRASQRVMSKLGFLYERDFVHAGLPHVFYRLKRIDWSGA